MHHTDNDGPKSVNAIEDEVIAHHKHPNVRRYLRSRWTKARMVGQIVATGDDPIDEAVSCGGTVQCDMQPNIIEVDAGARRKCYAVHASATEGLVGRQAFASAAFDIFSVQRLSLAAFDAFSPKPS